MAVVIFWDNEGMVMTSNPINLPVRFLLELAALAAYGYWGWHVGSGPVHFLLALGLSLRAALLWGLFAVPGDQVRSGKAPVLVPGIARLALEVVIFAGAVLALYAADAHVATFIFGAILLVQHLASYDRIAWLIRH